MQQPATTVIPVPLTGITDHWSSHWPHAGAAGAGGQPVGGAVGGLVGGLVELSVTVYHSVCLLACYCSCCLARGGDGWTVEGHWVTKDRAKLLSLQYIDCHWGELLTKSRPLLCDATTTVNDHTFMRCLIMYEIMTCRWILQDWLIYRSPS